MNTRNTIGPACAVLAIVALLMAGPVRSATLNLPATEDTFISEHFQPPLGEQLFMVMGTQGARVGTTQNHGLVRFGNLSQIPAGAIIHSVRFKLIVNKEPTGAPSAEFLMHRLLKEWDETNSSWVIRLNPDQNWDEPGGAPGTDFVAESSGRKQIDGPGSYFFDSTPTGIADVSGWVNNPANNFGWLITSTDESAHNARRFGTTEGFAGPALEVVYELPAPVLITGLSLNAGQFCLQFQVRPGKSYVVERRAALDNTPWTEIKVLPPAGTAETVTVCDPLGTGHGFYRVGER